MQKKKKGKEKEIEKKKEFVKNLKSQIQIPVRVLNCSKKNELIWFKVCWKDSDQNKLFCSWIESSKFRNENSDLVINYYESKLKFLEN